MADEFDPYYTWLAIPPEEQPPDHYRLLAVRRYEANTDVISNAADQRMTHLRSFQNGKHAAHSQKLLNEVSAARVMLLVAERKQAYDQELRAKEATSTFASAPPLQAMSPAPPLVPIEETTSNWLLSPAALPPPVQAPPPLSPAQLSSAAPLNIATKTHPSSTKPYQPTRSQELVKNPLFWIAVSLAGVAVLGGMTVVGGVLLWSSPKPRPVVDRRDPPTPGPRPQPVPTTPPVVSPTPPTVVVAPTIKPSPNPLVDLGSGNPLPGDKKSGNQKPGNGQRDTTIAQATSPTAVLNLIDHLDVVKSARGQSEVNEQGSLITDAAAAPAIVPIEVELPENYLIEATVTRTSGNDTFGMGLVVDGQQTMFEFDAFASAACGLDMIAGQRPRDANYPGAYKGALLPLNEKQYLVFFVHKDRLNVTCNGKTVFRWQGDPRTLGLVEEYQTGARPGLFVASWESSFEVRDFRLRPLKAPVDPFANVKPTVPARDFQPFSDRPAYSRPQVAERTTAPNEVTLTKGLPSAAAQKKAAEGLRKLLADDIAKARTPEAKRRLAGKLAQLAEDTRDDAPAQFVMFDEAIRLEIEAGELRAALQIIDAKGVQFPIDAEAIKLETMKQASVLARLPAQKKFVAETALIVANLAAAQEKFALAEDLLNLAVAAAGKANEPALRAQMVQRSKEVNELQNAVRQAEQAQDRLESDPQNPKANLAYGKYLCFVQEDYAAGWPYLAKSEHPQLAELAKAELSPALNDDVDRQIELADQWLNQASTANSGDKEQYLTRAYYWYRTARMRTTGIKNAKANKRCEDIEQLVGIPKLEARLAPKPVRNARKPPAGSTQTTTRAPTINLIDLVDIKRDTIKGEWAKVNGELRCYTTHLVPKLQLPYKPPKEYDLKITFSQPELRNEVSIIMPRDNKSFAWMLGGTQGIFRFSHDLNLMMNGVEPTKSLHPGAFVPGRRYTTIVQVRNDGVKAYFQGRLAAEHKTDYRDLRVDSWRQIPDASLLAIGCDDPTTFHEIALIEVSGPGEALSSPND